MTIREIQDEIMRLKKENDFCILAHAYMSQDVIEVADFVGDSFALSKKATTVPQKNILMCGVKFMAETVKILSPEKTVYVSHEDATCPMAHQMDVELLKQMKEKYPDYSVVAYINTTAMLKTLCDVCVTSSAAEKIIRNIDNKNILFIPDCNLGDYISKRVPEKNIKLVQGGCPTHVRMTVNDVKKARAKHPEAKLLVHPECLPAVSDMADYVGSTTGIVDYAKASDAKEFIIGTENSIVEHLAYDCPDKKFYPLSKDCVCHNMKLTTLVDVLNCVKFDGGKEIVLSEGVRLAAKRAIDKMLELGDK